jgi:hypothetical protein
MSQHHSNHGAAPSSNAAAESYIVTRGKPPREHQFKLGQSGNPRGRPKGSQNFRTLLQRELDRPITATNNGREVRMTKREAMVKRLVGEALKGNLKALDAVLQHSGEATASAQALPPMDTDPAREEAILMAYLARRDAEGTA